MQPVPLRTFIDVLQGEWRSSVPPSDSLVTEVSTDTRTIPQSSVFVALSGERFDGHAYVADAAEKGALASVVSKCRAASLPPGGSYIAVDDPLTAMERIAVWNRDRLKMTVVAVTGSVGKTSTKEFLATILSDGFRVRSAPKSFNNRIGVATTLLSASEDTEVLVAELGASGPGELSHLSRLVRPHRIVVTEIAAAHLEGFGDLDGVVRAKAEVFEGLVDGGTAFLRHGVRGFHEFAARAKGPIHTFGFDKGNYAITAWQRVSLGSCMTTRCSRGDYGYLFTINGTENLLLPVPGQHNIINATAAIAVARDLGMSWETIRSSLATCRLPPLRLHVHEAGGVVFVDDSYNSNPASMRAAIREWVSLSRESEAGETETASEPLRVRRTRVAVVGDMLELGGHSRRAHEDVGGELGEVGCRLVVTVGEDSRWIGSACSRVDPKTEVVHFSDAQESERFLRSSLRAGDHVLFKGSRRIGLDRVVLDLKEWLAVTPAAAATLNS